MPQISDYLKYKNVPFDELEEQDKEKMEKLISKIKEEKLNETLFLFDASVKNMIWNEDGYLKVVVDTTLPKDLSDKIAMIWQNL